MGTQKVARLIRIAIERSRPRIIEKTREDDDRRSATDIDHGGKEIDNDELLALECDILIPAAMEGVIHSGNCDALNTRLIVEGANAPFTCEADRYRNENAVAVVPDIFASAGGVIVSYPSSGSRTASATAGRSTASTRSSTPTCAAPGTPSTSAPSATRPPTEPPPTASPSSASPMPPPSEGSRASECHGELARRATSPLEGAVDEQSESGEGLKNRERSEP